MDSDWENPDASAAALRDGLLHADDVGELDAAGCLTLTDRAKDVVISGCIDIDPCEVAENEGRVPRTELRVRHAERAILL